MVAGTCLAVCVYLLFCLPTAYGNLAGAGTAESVYIVSTTIEVGDTIVQLSTTHLRVLTACSGTVS